ncbi:MAG: MBL fold metallo-hydrolase [Bacteroidaceae bacterium]|nr:MBL fold metallo-hydrolase [Bacteroidaceae bacterium]
MKITYIYHSCFVVESRDVAVVIDYYHDTDTVGGYVRDTVLGDKSRSIYVLSSHFHPDHFSPEVLEWRNRRPDITYIFSKDIYRHRRLPADTATWLVKGDVYDDGHLRVQAFGSTDVGISFLIHLDGFSIFHAGDLNNWSFFDDDEATLERRTKHFLGEIKDINKVFTEVDIAMFPIDGRLGDTYTDGARDFLERVHPRYFIPMHFSECGYASANLFKYEAELLNTSFVEIHSKGESFIF